MHNACMVALQIRDVPEDLRDALAAQAAAKGQSLQAFMLELAKAQGRRGENAAILRRFADRSDGSRTLPGETPAELEQQRSDRAGGE
jgi:plasmid stability protein